MIGGRDPFAWYLAGNADGRIILSQEPNYLQLLYEVLAPLAFLSWPAAKAAWVCCNVAMGLSCAYMLTRDAGLRGAWRVGAIATFVAATARSLDLEPSTANAVAYFGSVGAAGLGVLVMWRTRRGLEDGDIFAYLCALSLFAFFNNLYDYVLLAPLFFRSFRYPALPRAIAIGYVCFFWFGVKFAEPWLKSSAAIGAMTLASAAVFLLLVCRGAGDPESALSDDAAVALGPSGVTPLRDAALTAA